MNTSRKSFIEGTIATIALIFAAALPWIGTQMLALFGFSIRADVLLEFGFNALILAILAQGWNVIGGFTGYASFGNAVFFGLGAYGVGIAMVQWGLSFGTGMLFGVMMAVIFALLLGIPVLRLKGHYFAIATLALSQVIAAIISNIDLAGANQGLPFLSFLELSFISTEVAFYEMALMVLAFATAVIFWLKRSRLGFGLIAIRENEDGAAAMGVNTTLYKVIALTLAGVFSALAGGIYAYKMAYIDPDQVFNASWNVKMIIMAVFGGAGTVFGPIFGSITLSAISDILASVLTNVAGLFFGVVIILAVLLTPRGLTDMLIGVKKDGLRYFIDNIRATKL